MAANLQMSASMSQALDRFSHQYLQLQLKLDFPDAEYLRNAGFQKSIYCRLFREDSIQYPPPRAHQFRVLKELIKRIEQSIQNWEEEVWYSAIFAVHDRRTFTPDKVPP